MGSRPFSHSSRTELLHQRSDTLLQGARLIRRSQDDGAGLQLRVLESASVLHEIGFRGHGSGCWEDIISKKAMQVRERLFQTTFIAESPLLDVFVRTEEFNPPLPITFVEVWQLVRRLAEEA